MIINLFSKKREIINKARLEGFEKGQKITEAEKNKEMNGVKLNHKKAIKDKNSLLKRYRKRVKRIEKGKEDVQEILMRLAFITQKLLKEKYSKLLEVSDEYRECLRISTEVEALMRKFERVSENLDNEIELFRMIS